MISRRTFLGGVAAAAVMPRLAMAAPITAIDSHAHVFKRDLKLAPNIRYAPDYDATPEDYVKVLDANGISNAVLVQPSFLGTDNVLRSEGGRRAVQQFSARKHAPAG